MKLSEKISNKAHRVLVYGPPKGGKTELVGRLSEVFNLLFFDLDNGIETLRKLPMSWQERIEVISMPDTRSFPVGIETSLKVIKGGKYSICDAHAKVSCGICKTAAKSFVEVHLNELPHDTIVVFDSLTQLTNSAISHMRKDKDDDYKFDWDDWAKLGILMDTFLSHVQQAGFNIVCISHETEVEMEDGKMKLVPSAGTRNFSRNTARYFDEVIYCEIVNKAHKFSSSSTYSNTVLTGSRTGAVLEASKSPAAALISIFKGEIPTYNPMTADTPATTALTALQKLSQKMKDEEKK